MKESKNMLKFTFISILFLFLNSFIITLFIRYISKKPTELPTEIPTELPTITDPPTPFNEVDDTSVTNIMLVIRLFLVLSGTLLVLNFLQYFGKSCTKITLERSLSFQKKINEFDPTTQDFEQDFRKYLNENEIDYIQNLNFDKIITTSDNLGTLKNFSGYKTENDYGLIDFSEHIWSLLRKQIQDQLSKDNAELWKDLSKDLLFFRIGIQTFSSFCLLSSLFGLIITIRNNVKTYLIVFLCFMVVSLCSILKSFS